ncbi:hypothetical protein MLD38_022149 [Melastoma candidum]|uniref:Uncharacterized protein n=1 Tax=Melastoma candidum TaxID=119954 RepID=A0ACB9QI81_9MYRT|nr:hypothetical protein MLD38_022149 [Melastoma candidum]
MAEEQKRVCVTGAGGFIASWLVKLLLARGYQVHGTIRDPGDVKKNAHLFELDGASENLRLFKAELLDYDSLLRAIKGCAGVFHLASPVYPPNVVDQEVDVIEPAVKGTVNVLNACVEAKVKRVIVVSSAAAVANNPNWPKDRVMDETCWSDNDFQRKNERWYAISKTLSESKAVEFGKKGILDVVTVCPTVCLGPILQSTINSSSEVLINLLKEGEEERENMLRRIVDVRDVADALLLTYEEPECEGRYICTAHMVMTRDLVEKLKSMYPGYSYPKRFGAAEDAQKMSSEKLQKLGWKYRPLEETLMDSVQCYQQSGIV